LPAQTRIAFQLRAVDLVEN